MNYGSSARVEFVAHGAREPRCCVNWLDADRSPAAPVVRAKFTCDYLPEGDFVEAYYDGQVAAGRPVPYFTHEDVTAMVRRFTDVRVIAGRDPDVRGRVVFEILPAGYDWGEHSTIAPSLIDLGDRAVQVYVLGFRDWNWRPINEDELPP